MAMGLASGHDLELTLLKILIVRRVESDNEQNLSCYPCSKGTYER